MGAPDDPYDAGTLGERAGAVKDRGLRRPRDRCRTGPPPRWTPSPTRRARRSGRPAATRWLPV